MNFNKLKQSIEGYKKYREAVKELGVTYDLSEKEIENFISTQGKATKIAKASILSDNMSKWSNTYSSEPEDKIGEEVRFHLCKRSW